MGETGGDILKSNTSVQVKVGRERHRAKNMGLFAVGSEILELSAPSLRPAVIRVCICTFPRQGQNYVCNTTSFI